MRWLTRKILNSIVERPSRSYQNGPRLRLEPMEDRLAPAVVTLPVNATHSFVSQLAAANPGDTLQIEPGAILGTLGTTGSTTAAANAGNSTIAVNAVFATGQIITISHSGDITETALIDAVSGPTGGVYTLTLHKPLTDSHQSGSTVTATLDTLGIGKGITIQGDPIAAPSSLLNGTTLEYFTQNGTPLPDALSHLLLTAVEGTTSSNLSITGNTFNIPTGITDAISVVSEGTVTISNNTFTIGSSAHLVTVVSGQTGAGAITFTGDTITANSPLGSNAVALTSSSGPISVTGFSLTASGIGGDGLYINTSGDVTVAGTNKINVTGAVTGSALEIGSGAAASISNVTVLLSSDAGADGINASSVSGNLTASNLNVTVDGSVMGNSGDGAAIDLNATGNATVSNLTTLVQHTAKYGLFVEADGNLLISGTEKATVTGSVADDGIYIYTSDGAVTVSASLSVTLGSSADYGLYLKASSGSLTDTGAITVNVTGAVTTAGAYLYGGTSLSVAAVSATLGSTASYGVAIEGYTATVNGAVTATVTGAVVNDGVNIESYYGPLTLNSSITVKLSSSTTYGAYLYGEESNLIVHGPITVNVTGAVSEEGLYAYGGDNTTIGGKVLVTIGGTANYGVEIEADEGTLNDTAGVNVSITGAVTDDAAYFYSTAAATVSNVTVSASDIASGEGIYFETEDGGNGLTATNLNVTANNGTSSAYGVSLYSYYGGPITASGITVNMNAAADYGLYVYSEYASKVSLRNVSVNITGAASYGVYEEQYYSGGGTSLTNVAATIGGAASDGIYVSDEYNGTMTLSGVSATLKSTADYGIYAYGYGGAVIDGSINASVTDAVSDYGVYIYSEYSDVAVSSPINVHLGSTAEYGLYVDADEGSLVDTAPATVTITGNVTDDGAYMYSNVNLSLAANLSVTLGGTASAAAYLESEYGSVTDTAGMSLSVTGQIGSGGEGLYVYGDSGDTIDNVQITLKNGSAGYGAYIDGSKGNISANNLKLNVTGAVTDDGLYIYTDGNITTSAVSVNLSSTAEYGIYADSISSNLTMTNTTDSVGGALTDYGAYLYSESAENITHLNVVLASTSEYALYAESEYDNLALSALSLTEAGLASSEGAFLESHWGNLSFANSTIAMNGGLTNPSADYAVQVETPFGNTAINADKITVKGSAEAGLTTTANGSMKLTNTNITTGGGNALLLNGSSGNPQTIENNTFSTTGTGTGLAFGGGDLVVALIQGNNFVSNLVGVAITGDGTNAGNIDLGGGLLGSTGKNNFSGFTGTSNHYALTLASTNATSTVYALHNTFTVADPNAVVQDAAHDGGTGIIDV